MELPSTIPGRRSPWTAAGALAGLLLISSTTIWAQVSAEQLVAAGKLEEAIRIYKDLAKADPANPNLLLNLSITEYKSKHYHEAATHAAAALKLQPDLLPAQLFLGASHLELGEFARAIQPLEQVIAANPRERNARLMLGEALLEDGKPEKAIPHLTAATALLPMNPRAWYALARAHEALSETQAASEAWKNLSALPPSVESHLHAAQVHDAAQRWRESVVEWNAALTLAPDNRAARTGLAWALFRARDHAGAMAALKPLLASKTAGVQFLYGASLLNLQQPDAAIPYLRAAIAADPAFLPARAALGQALLQTGKPAEAIPLLSAAAPTDTDGNIHFQLFRAYQLTHRDAEARQALAGYQRIRAH